MFFLSQLSAAVKSGTLFNIKSCNDFIGGGSRIRTHGTSRHNGFQDRRLQPLGHPSKKFLKKFFVTRFSTALK